MLQDHVRTTTYQSAFFQNYMDFAGKVGRSLEWMVIGPRSKVLVRHTYVTYEVCHYTSKHGIGCHHELNVRWVDISPAPCTVRHTVVC